MSRLGLGRRRPSEVWRPDRLGWTTFETLRDQTEEKKLLTKRLGVWETDGETVTLTVRTMNQLSSKMENAIMNYVTRI